LTNFYTQYLDEGYSSE